jgi:hypothetical protein
VKENVNGCCEKCAKALAICLSRAYNTKVSAEKEKI